MENRVSVGKSTSLGSPGAAALAEQGQQGPEPALMVDSVLKTPVVIDNVLTGLLVQRAPIAQRAPTLVPWKRTHANPSLPAFTLGNNRSGAREQTQLSESMFCVIRRRDKPGHKSKGTASAQAPSNPQPPLAMISGPTKLGAACAGSSAIGITFSGKASPPSSNRQLTS